MGEKYNKGKYAVINKGCSFRFFDDNSEDVNYTEENLPIRSVISVQEDYPTYNKVFSNPKRDKFYKSM